MEQFVDLCSTEDGAVSLARTGAGALFLRREDRWESYDFNALHSGFYPSCTFTALARAGELFYLAGTDGDGVPHLFSSLLGGVWEERNLTARSPVTGTRRASGRIIRILFDGERRQTFLLCDSGELVTLPDCPRCVRITDVPGGRAEDARLEGRYLVVRMADGAERRLSIDSVSQYRISGQYFAQLLAEGAVLADLRTEEEYAASHWPGSVHVPLENVEDWLETRERSRVVVFLCHTGRNADAAARYARGMGFARAYSLGGTVSAAHIE